MALHYRPIDEKTVRAYERSPGMEPNPAPGVTHLAVVSNRGRRPSRNPFQWIEGRGQRHEHVSRPYDTMAKARAWKKSHGDSPARLYPVDEKGTIVSRPVRRKLSGNPGKETEEMAYNTAALRRAMRSNPRKRRISVNEEETERGVKVSSRARRKTTKRRASARRRPTANRRRKSRRTSVKRNTKRRRKSRRTSVTANRRRSRRTSVKRKSRRTSVTANRRRRSRRTSVKRNARRGTGRQTSKGKTARKRRPSARWKSHFKEYVAKGYAPTAAPYYRSSNTRGRRPSVLMYPVPRGQGRLTSRGRRVVSAKLGGSRKKLAANRRRSSRRRRSRSLVSNRRRSRRSSRKGSRRSRRSSKLMANRRRSSRRRMTPNLLTKSRVKWRGTGAKRRGRLTGRSYQVLMYGPGSKSRPGKSGRRKSIKGYPVYIPGHVVERGAVRRYTFGGAAKRAHTRKRTTQAFRGFRSTIGGRKDLRKNSRSSSMRNRRKSRRRSTRRNPKYVIANRRKSRRSSKRRGTRRRVRRNPMSMLYGADLMNDVLIPVASGTAGFVGARVLSNALANMDAVRNLLDKDKPASEASNTKIAANVLGIVATLGLGTKVQLVKKHQGALVTGMGLALVDRLLGKVTGDAAGYLSGLGEYVNQPLGEYVNQPLGAYVNDPSMGEYVNQPLGGLGTLYAAAGYNEGVDPANQAGVDGMMDTMEAAAGMGTMEAAAGMGTMYATAGMGTLYAAAGLGAESDAGLKAYYAGQQPPFASIQTPTDMARPVTGEMPYADPVPESLVTPEGRGYAGGLFSRNLFAGML